MRNSRALPALLAGSAAIMIAALLNQANAETAAESLECDGDKYRLIQFDFADSPANAHKGTAEAAAADISDLDLLDMPSIETSFDSIRTDVQSLGLEAEGIDAQVAAISDGKLLAVIQLEGSEKEGWHPSTVVRCVS